MNQELRDFLFATYGETVPGPVLHAASLLAGLVGRLPVVEQPSDVEATPSPFVHLLTGMSPADRAVFTCDPTQRVRDESGLEEAAIAAFARAAASGDAREAFPGQPMLVRFLARRGDPRQPIPLGAARFGVYDPQRGYRVIGLGDVDLEQPLERLAPEIARRLRDAPYRPTKHPDTVFLHDRRRPKVAEAHRLFAELEVAFATYRSAEGYLPLVYDHIMGEATLHKYLSEAVADAADQLGLLEPVRLVRVLRASRPEDEVVIRQLPRGVDFIQLVRCFAASIDDVAIGVPVIPFVEPGGAPWQNHRMNVALFDNRRRGADLDPARIRATLERAKRHGGFLDVADDALRRVPPRLTVRLGRALRRVPGLRILPNSAVPSWISMIPTRRPSVSASLREFSRLGVGATVHQQADGATLLSLTGLSDAEHLGRVADALVAGLERAARVGQAK